MSPLFEKARAIEFLGNNNIPEEKLKMKTREEIAHREFEEALLHLFELDGDSEPSLEDSLEFQRAQDLKELLDIWSEDEPPIPDDLVESTLDKIHQLGDGEELFPSESFSL